jgi:hypothetical protein
MDNNLKPRIIGHRQKKKPVERGCPEQAGSDDGVVVSGVRMAAGAAAVPGRTDHSV